MADYHAIISIGYADIIDNFLPRAGGTMYTYKDFFEAFLTKVKNTQGITAGNVEVGTDYVRLELPIYDGTYDANEKLYILVKGNLSYDIQWFTSKAFYIGIATGSNTTTPSQDVFLYRQSTGLSYITLRSLIVGDRSSVRNSAKLMIIQEELPYINGYRLACAGNSRDTPGSSTSGWYTYDFLDACTLRYVTKGINSVTKTTIPVVVSTDLSTYSGYYVNILDGEQHTRIDINKEYIYQPTVPDNEIYYSRLFNGVYYAENMYMNGDVTNGSSSAHGGGNMSLHEYLYLDGSDTNNEYEGLTKDGIMIGDDEYCGIIRIGSGSYSFSPSTNEGKIRLLFKKNPSS